MGYCYARRLSLPCSDALVQSLRAEIYIQPYDTIFWPSHRGNVCHRDIHTPHHPALLLLLRVLNRYEQVRAVWPREQAVREILEQIRADDRFSDFISIGPISKVRTTLACIELLFACRRYRLWSPGMQTALIPATSASMCLA